MPACRRRVLATASLRVAAVIRAARSCRPPPPVAVRLLDRRIDGGHDATRGFHTLTFHMT